MSGTTGFFWDEACFWHGGGNYAFLAPVGGLVQPLAGGGLAEDPETKRRAKNLIDRTGLAAELACQSAAAATVDDLLRVHPKHYIEEFAALSRGDGGELGERTPFGPGGFDIACLSAGLVCGAVDAVVQGDCRNAYALSRPPGHHCLPDRPMGFCLLANIAIAVERAIAQTPGIRIAVVDWDVHHGNGTEAIYWARSDVLTISLHQEHNYPRTTGAADHRGAGAGEGFNINVPLPPGGGDAVYHQAISTIVVPALRQFHPDLIVIACGFDASGVDPLSRMLVSSASFADMTDQLMVAADELCAGRLVCAHEGGYSELHVPFCAHAVLQTLAGSTIHAPDPIADRLAAQQPNDRLTRFHLGLVDEMALYFAADQSRR